MLLVPHPLSPLLSIRNSSGSSSFPIVNCQTEGKLSERRNLGREGGRALAANGRLEWFWQQWRRVDSFLLLLLLSPLHTPTHATRDLVVPLTLLCQQQFRSGMNAQNYNSNESQLLFAQINSDHFLLAPGQK